MGWTGARVISKREMMPDSRMEKRELKRENASYKNNRKEETVNNTLRAHPNE